MIQIYTESDEFSAAITKGYLESNGIKTSIAPGNDSLSLSPLVLRGPNVSYGIYVLEENEERARQLLKERI